MLSPASTVKQMHMMRCAPPFRGTIARSGPGPGWSSTRRQCAPQSASEAPACTPVPPFSLHTQCKIFLFEIYALSHIMASCQVKAVALGKLIDKGLGSCWACLIGRPSPGGELHGSARLAHHQTGPEGRTDRSPARTHSSSQLS